MATIIPREREAVLELRNEWEELGMRKVVLRQLASRFTRVPAVLKRRIGQLPELILEELAVALLDFKTIVDAEAWVSEHKS